MLSQEGYADQGANKTAREATLNERLNRAGDALALQCDRIESVLARVNGVPQKDAQMAGTAPTPIRATQSLAQMVENMEVLAKRLTDLRNGVERIA